METMILPFSVELEDHTVINEVDLSLPEAIALNNLEASQTDLGDLKLLFKRMTIGKKLLLERCERYEQLKKFGSAPDIIENEKELVEKSTLDFLKAREAFYKRFNSAS